MRVIIVRHGKAEQLSETGRDEDRRLKGRGEKQAGYVGEYFAEEGRRPRLIVASRFERAFETARIIQRVVGCPLQTAPELESGEAVAAAVELLGQHAADPLMIVGHNPQLSQLVWVLTKGMPPEEAGLRTGEAVVIDVDQGEPVGNGREVERVRMDESE
jgi:phosphohistidine phosphatase